MARRSSWFRLSMALLACCAVLAAALAGWIVHLDHLVTRQFQGRHWSIPARVYAAPLEMYAGAPVSANALEEELIRLHYRPGDPAASTGSYRRRGNSFDLHTRRVRFEDELRQPQRILITADTKSINSLQSFERQDLAIFRLDPPTIGSVSPVHGEDRLILTPAEIPSLLRAGIKLIEDRRFDDHNGIDARGLLRAVWVNLRERRIAQGGSTLTQQLVKNYFLSDEQSLRRKLTEALMAVRLEAHFSKEDILIAYLNEVYLGQDGSRAIHGFGLGSEYYFAKPLDELEPAELALLIGLVKGPSYYDPRKHPDRALARRNLVLREFTEAHLLDAAAASSAAAATLGLKPPGGSYVPAYLDLVRRHLKRDYADGDLAAAGLSIYTSLDLRAQAAAERALTLNLIRLDAAGRSPNSRLQGAVIIAEPGSGDVVAVVGGRDAAGRNGGAESFNRALDARRPIGSLVKPAVYLTALESGRYNAATLILDAPLELKLPDGGMWAPQNFERRTYGQVPMARALAESLNLATVRLGLELGLPAVADTLQRLGMETPPALNPSMLLGTVEMTPLEMLQIYSTLANGGFRTRLRAVHAVLDEHGDALKRFKVNVEEAAPAAPVYELDRMLTLVTTRGTGRDAAARLPPNLIVAGKTGTSSDTRDSWFAGFTGGYAAVAWVGYDDNRVTGLTGAAGALPVWAEAIAALKPASYVPAAPDGVEDRWIGFIDGLETDPTCGSDAVALSLPTGAYLTPRSDCSAALARNGNGSMRDGATARDGTHAALLPDQDSGPAAKIKAWFKRWIH